MSIESLKEKLNQEKVKVNELLAPYTTLKVGGPADLFYTADSSGELTEVVKLAKEYEVPVTVIGWASNVLISDKGIRGLVIKYRSNNIEIIGEVDKEKQDELKTKARLVQADKRTYYDFSEIDFDESSYPIVQVKADAGVAIQFAINTLINKGITGLQWFSGIPGTIGGAIYNNIHGGAHFMEEFVDSVEILDEDMQIRTLPKSELNFDYDYSRFHKTKEIILSAILDLRKGDIERARNASIEWARRKKLQPAKSAGCNWQNIDEETQKKLNLESNSWGYIIDKVLGLKGKRVGGAQISEHHAAFMENIGDAKAADVLELMKLVHNTSKEKLDITPKPEIFLLGFDPEEIKEFI
jgi:UDP-N-acetylmuramate dehydrogenase